MDEKTSGFVSVSAISPVTHIIYPLVLGTGLDAESIQEEGRI